MSARPPWRPRRRPRALRLRRRLCQTRGPCSPRWDTWDLRHDCPGGCGDQQPEQNNQKIHRPRPRFQSRSRTHKRNNATGGLHHRLGTAVSEESLRQTCDFLCKTPGDCETSVTRLDQTYGRRYKRRACLCFTLVVRTFSRTHESRSARMRPFEWLAPGVVADGLWVRHCHRVRRRPVRRQVAGIIDAHTVIAGGCRPAQGGRSRPGVVIPDIRCGARRSVPRADRHAEGHRRQRPDGGQADFDQPGLRHREQMRGRRLECERTLERVRRPCGIRRRGRRWSSERATGKRRGDENEQ